MRARRRIYWRREEELEDDEAALAQWRTVD